jgi:hypothetical protein
MSFEKKKSKIGEVSRQHEGPNVRIGINIKRTYEAKKKNGKPKHVRELLVRG